jgi:hypothetical protein
LKPLSSSWFFVPCKWPLIFLGFVLFTKVVFFSHMCSLWFDLIISLFTLFDIVNFLMPFGLATKQGTWLPYYLGSFDINYIIFKNVEFLTPKNQSTICGSKSINCEGKYWIFNNINIPFVNMKIPNLIN